ncbi:DUF6055 domain-containing protein [Desertivirga arenae]|uniref:DUF6055 domain-containing protein n=1 Tax=Desertivirga arenae TaxID=2810309 RepID=UPI001A972F91|nr:DUF6055 domain-containing protein [Pedobacter sp. SYSU D00823]
MTISQVQRLLLPLLFLLQFNPDLVAASYIHPNDSLKKAAEKELYLPKKIWRVPENNNYNNKDSEYCIQRMVQSDNVAIFWAREFGENPLSNADGRFRFDVYALLKDCERFYTYYVDTLKFVDKGHSLTDKYKVLFFIFPGNEGTAFGGGEEDKVGVLWSPAARVAKPPFGALAHELGHSFQFLVHFDGPWGFSTAPAGAHGQTIFEMTSQYMLWQVEPEWLTFENYHLRDYLKKTHYAFLHETNQYHSPFVLEYWSNKFGKDFVGKLWKQARPGEDVVMAYKRITSKSQKAFNDEMFDAARRFVTWDMKRIEKVASKYANQHSTSLVAADKGWYTVSPVNCPQNYGYNAISLKVPTGGAKVKLSFEGMPGAEGFRKIHLERAGWRYGFLAVKADGARVYGKVFSDKDGNASFKVPKDAKWLWLIVSGAPEQHWEHLADGKEENDEQWPYKIKLAGTAPIQ